MEILNAEQFLALFNKHDGDLSKVGAYEVTEKVTLVSHKILENINLGTGVFPRRI